MDPIERGKLTMLKEEGRIAVTISLNKQEGTQSSRAQVDRLALEVLTSSSPIIAE